MLRTLIIGLSALVAGSAGPTAASHPATVPPPTARVVAVSHADDGYDSRAFDAALARQQPAAQPPNVQDVIRTAFAPLGDGAVNWAEAIAACESTYDPNAVNADSGAEGLFQFLPSTWRGTPYASQSPFDPVANASAAVWLLQTYGAGQWECRA